MNNPFEHRLQAAATAGWWVILIAVLFLIVQWIAYLVVMDVRPEWIRCLWGPGISWARVQSVWFGMMVVFKVIMWVVLLLVIWLTLWARRLKKTSGAA